MKILNLAVTPICPECMKIMVIDNLPTNQENTDVTIACITHNCVNEGVEYILTLPFIEVFKKEQ